MSILKEITLTVQRILQELIPSPQYRIPLTWKTVPYAFGYLIPCLFNIYLSRRRNTYGIRLLLLPTVLISIIRGTYGYGGHNPEFAFYTWLRGLGGLTAAALTLKCALTQEGILKVGETILPPIVEPISSPPTEEPDEKTKDDAIPKRKPSLNMFSTALWDAFELAFAMRGIGWKFGRGVYIPKNRRPHQRGPFLKATAWNFFKNFLIMDFVLAVFKLMPGLGTPAGGSIYYSELPLIPRYAVAFGISIISGFVLLSGFDVLADGGALIGVGLLGQSPSQWPPILKNPWGAQSLHEFWGRRWHQTLREPFLVFGGYPGRWLAGRNGWIIGTFLASGLMHELSVYLLGRGLDHRVIVFFFLQGVGVLLEKAWTKTIGHRVGGIPGRVWTYLMVLGLGQITLDAWFERGLAGGSIIPRALSPSTVFVAPVLQNVARNPLS